MGSLSSLQESIMAGHYGHGDGHLPAAGGAKGGAWNRLGRRCSHGARSGGLEDGDLKHQTWVIDMVNVNHDHFEGV